LLLLLQPSTASSTAGCLQLRMVVIRSCS
jgi:hypothetical protein